MAERHCAPAPSCHWCLAPIYLIGENERCMSSVLPAAVVRLPLERDFLLLCSQLLSFDAINIASWSALDNDINFQVGLVFAKDMHLSHIHRETAPFLISTALLITFLTPMIDTSS